MQRRNFIQNLLWITGGLLAGCSKRLSSATREGAVIKGKVLSGGKGVADVVVSDGFSVVKTSANGSYEFRKAPLAEHVFVSVPAGYALPHEKHIARHYKDLGTTDNWNFELEALGVNDDQHQFMIWADPQIKNDNDVRKLMTQSVPDVQNYMKSLPANALIHGICVGDLVWDNLPLFSNYNAAIDQCGLPFFQVIGNHDMDYRMGGDETSDNTFKKTYGPSYYSFNRGQVHYVVLDDVWYLGNEREYKGFITDEQLAWLAKDLSFVAKDKLLVLCAHIPVHAVENKQALYNLITEYKVHIMTGHTHYNNNIINDNVYEHVHGTVCGAWWTGPICGDGTPPGYAVYEVNGTELKWFYKSVGQPRDHQIRAMMERGTSNEQQLVANVWNWDPTWKVEYQVDGVNKGALPRFTDFDPMAVALYKGDQLPKSRPFVEPRKTDHVFKATIPQGAQQVKVLATDRFGNKYELVA
ncbi:metallophosphoesterase [Segetibacter sp. 3557_3]|uniref:calcineurin-like phosphoesterase C-terminal domain-containing protein n=1 Tax=Segetibacter sp. 3557_3 TaxID=2547429 RepID=UPI001058F454|nr:calcineurin-like phosphoesterase family protein [Segetibacter sp. 3557_3]TDH28665.1 metallophosphoesterase [Segetibacter sp. 3557_3]